MIVYNHITVENYHNGEPAFFKTYEPGTCPISDTLRSGVVWEEHLHNIFEKYVTKDSVVVEGGCHIGSHTVKLAQMAKTVHAFAPLPDSFN